MSKFEKMEKYVKNCLTTQSICEIIYNAKANNQKKQ